MDKTKFSNLLIDGYNLIHAIPAISVFSRTDLQRARELLLLKLSAYASRNGIKITVVFDGKAEDVQVQKPHPGVSVIFTRGEKADRKIIELARKITNKKDWLVITSDFDIRFQVEGFRIKTRSSQEFAAELEAGAGLKKHVRNKNYDRVEEKKATREDLDWAYEVFLKNKKQ